MAERRPLLRLAVPIPRDSQRPLHAAVRVQPRGRPGGSRARAARGQQDHPPRRRIRRPGPASVSRRVAVLNLQEAAAQAQAYAEAGDERAIADLRRKWEDELEGAARHADYRIRAVAYRAIGQFRFRQKLELLHRGLEDESPACRGSAQRETIVLLGGLAENDEESKELREAARKVAAQLTKKSRAR